MGHGGPRPTGTSPMARDAVGFGPSVSRFVRRNTPRFCRSLIFRRPEGRFARNGPSRPYWSPKRGRYAAYSPVGAPVFSSNPTISRLTARCYPANLTGNYPAGTPDNPLLGGCEEGWLVGPAAGGAMARGRSVGWVGPRGWGSGVRGGSCVAASGSRRLRSAKALKLGRAALGPNQSLQGTGGLVGGF